MKSNIGLVFVVNAGKAFGRFVKEFAGEEEIGRANVGVLDILRHLEIADGQQ